MSLAVALMILCALPGLSSAAGASSVQDDQAAINKLEQQIASQGDHIKSLVTRSNEVQTHIASLEADAKRTEKSLAADALAEDAAARVAQRVAVRAYVGGAGADTQALALFTDSKDTTTLLAGQVYAGAINSRLSDAISELRDARAKTEHTRGLLRSQQADAKKALADLTRAKKDAQNAIVAEQALLSKAQGNLMTRLAAAAAERRRAQEAQTERQLALAGNAGPSNTPPPPPIHPAPGTYSNPLRGISGLVPERIDQGVDFAGFGPIMAIGSGVILTTSVPGWPGGTFIGYRLTDGPAAGLCVFAAEDIQPQVSAGQTVDANTVLGQLYGGPDGIETGWADCNALGNTMARTYGQYGGGNSTAFGANFSQLLQAVGAPGGVLQNNPPTGSLPAGWPQW